MTMMAYTNVCERPTSSKRAGSHLSLFLLVESGLQSRRLVRNKPYLVCFRLRCQGRRICHSLDWMILNMAVGNDLEAVQDAQKENIEFSICQLHAHTHSRPRTKAKDRRIRSLKPAVRAKFLWIVPQFLICRLGQYIRFSRASNTKGREHPYPCYKPRH